jgi:DNA-binding MurR/RpiR family transcriptional regulator
MNKLKKESHSKLTGTILKKYPELSTKEKKVADYIIQNHQTSFALSGKDLSKNTGVSEATIVRFAQHLGFEGFHHLKSQMIMEAKEGMKPEDRFKLMVHENQISTIFKVAKQDVDNINQTINRIDRQQFERFIKLIRGSSHVYTIGLGISSLMARIAAYLLNQAGIKANFCGKDEHAFIERLVHLTKRDLVLALSFPPYSKETVNSLKFCYQRNVRCLGITDKPTAPLTRWCHAYLIVKSRNLLFTNSISALSMILNALATELALLNKDKSANSSKLVYKILGKDFYS